MVQASEIGWGSYQNFEGPYFLGRAPFVLPDVPAPEEETMAVITAAEGGHYDAWNGYDSCGWTSGLIQFCEHNQYSVSDMLGAVASAGRGDLLNGLMTYASSVDVGFDRGPSGKWRFLFKDSRGFIDNPLKQQQLFYKNGNGSKGSWTNDTKLYAKGWAAAISSVWEQPEAQLLQCAFTAGKLGQFFTQSAKNFFSTMPTTQVAKAMWSAYASFAVNNPSWASSALQQSIASYTGHPYWEEQHLVNLLKHLTFDPHVAIYPARYNAIRPVLEKLYQVQLPDFAAELQTWVADTGLPTNLTTKQLQLALISLGYDLGPTGADGKYGGKTKAALFSFEQFHGVPAAKQDGMIDEYTYPALEKVLAAHGTSFADFHA